MFFRVQVLEGPGFFGIQVFQGLGPGSGSRIRIQVLEVALYFDSALYKVLSLDKITKSSTLYTCYWDLTIIDMSKLPNVLQIILLE